MFSKSSKQSPAPASAPQSAPAAPASTSQAAPKPSPAPTGSAAGTPIPSIISADLTILGDLISEGDVQVEGTVKGDIRSRSLTIGQSAKIAHDLVRLGDLARDQGTGERAAHYFRRALEVARAAGREEVAQEAAAKLKDLSR